MSHFGWRRWLPTQLHTPCRICPNIPISLAGLLVTLLTSIAVIWCKVSPNSYHNFRVCDRIPLGVEVCVRVAHGCSDGRMDDLDREPVHKSRLVWVQSSRRVSTSPFCSLISFSSIRRATCATSKVCVRRLWNTCPSSAEAMGEPQQPLGRPRY